MTHSASELSYPVRWVVLKKYFGQICLVIAALTSVPAVVSLVTLDLTAAVALFVITSAAGVIGVIGSRTTATQQVQRNEALVVSCATFLFISVTMSIPFMAYGLDVSDAFFESVSAVTTTGLTTLASVEDRPVSFLFTRAWMQWYGGLGIVVFSVALITQSGVAAKSLAVGESSEMWSLGGVRLYARRVLVVYSVLTLVGFVVIALHGVGAKNALLYALTAVSTGGFTPHDSSLAGIGGWPVQVIVIIVCLSGAVPLSVYYRSFRDGWMLLLREKQVQALLIASCTASLLLFFCLRGSSDRSALESIFDGLLLGISAQSTTGFETVEVASLGDAPKLALLWPMFVGGGVGSSAGGIKLVRILILTQLLWIEIAKASLPKHAVIKPHLFGQPLEDKEIGEASILLFAYLILVGVSWLPFVMFGYDALDSLFEVVSASGTVGLSAGVASQQLPMPLKFVLSADMLMGRLEVFAWLVVLSRRTWFGKQVKQS